MKIGGPTWRFIDWIMNPVPFAWLESANPIKRIIAWVADAWFMYSGNRELDALEAALHREP